MDVRGLLDLNLGETPFDTINEIINSNEGYSCGSGDSFVKKKIERCGRTATHTHTYTQQLEMYGEGGGEKEGRGDEDKPPPSRQQLDNI